MDNFIYAFGVGVVMFYILIGEKITMNRVKLAVIVSLLWPIFILLCFLGVVSQEDVKEMIK